MSGRCLASQEIKQLIFDKVIKTEYNEKNIQPSSLELPLGRIIYVLDTESKGLIRPESDEPIYKTLLRLPFFERKHFDLDGFEMKKGYTYLIPLDGTVQMSEDMHIISSPKSSMGRLFLNTRMLCDCNNSFDEVNYNPDQEGLDLNFWLLVQPLKFSVIPHPGLTLNQLRFIKGDNMQLSQRELKNEHLLWNDDLTPAVQDVNPDGMTIHLDLKGSKKSGIVGLRARNYSIPIDLKLKNYYSLQDYFEPIKIDPSSNFLSIRSGEYYLFSSQEIIRVPEYLNVNLNNRSQVGFAGYLHFAGFIDNGFNGDIVYEVRSDEQSNVVLEDGMPVTKITAIRTSIPDKLYGKSIGSSYNGQKGVTPSNVFASFDPDEFAKLIKKLDKNVLVLDANDLLRFRKSNSGFESLENLEDIVKLFSVVNSFNNPKLRMFQSRYYCEYDEALLQPIAYMIIHGRGDTYFIYIRSDNQKEYGDKRLFGKYSIAVGGHPGENDGPDFIINSLKRERDEEVYSDKDFSEPVLLGTIMARDTFVDRVHFGFLYECFTDGIVKAKEASIKSGRMMTLDQILSLPQDLFETWSQIVISYLKNKLKLNKST